MAELFAALTANGDIKFIGEVPRGRGCGCFCPSCGSSLVAKLGNINEWHFGHEALQERPDCEVGAHNLLRRLCVEYLYAKPILKLPIYRQTLRRPTKFGLFSETAEWDSEILKSSHWDTRAPNGAPVATLSLSSGLEIDLHVEIGSQKPTQQASFGHGKVVFYCPLPSASSLRTSQKATEWLQHQGSFFWVFQPDTEGHVKAARARLMQRLATAETAKNVMPQGSHGIGTAMSPGQIWAAKAAKLRALEFQLSANSAHPTLSPAAPRVVAGPAWIADMHPGSSFFFWRLTSGSSWVMFKRNDDTYCIVPWPVCEEGWDEELPPSVGEADSSIGAYRIKDVGNAMIWMGAKSIVVRITTEFRELLSL